MSALSEITELQAGLAPLRVLLADHTGLLERFVTAVLDAPSVELASAENALELQHRSLSFRPDVLLLNAHLPELSVSQFCKAFKATTAGFGASVILIMSSRPQDAITASFEAGVDDFLTVPFVAAELVAKIRATLLIRAARAEGNALRKQLHEARSYARECELDAERFKGELETLSVASNDRFEATQTALKAEVDALRSELEKTRDQTAELRSLKAELLVTRQRAEARDIVPPSGEVTVLKSELKELRARLAEVTAVNAIPAEPVAPLKAEIARLRTEHEAAAKSRELETRELIGKIQDECDRLRLELAQAQKEAATWRDDLARLQAQSERLTAPTEAILVQPVREAPVERASEVQISRLIDELEQAYRLRRYLSPVLVERIMASSDEPFGAIAKRKEITFMYVDIRDFTEMSDQLDPSRVSQLLNEIHAEVCEPILARGGTVNKFLGDGMLVIFGDPFPQKDHRLLALQAALEIKERIKRFGERRDTLPAPFHVAIALHAGFATVGNFGTRQQIDYTAIGKVVSLAARLLAYSHDDAVIATADTYKSLGDKLTLRDEREVNVRGFSEKVMIAEILSLG